MGGIEIALEVCQESKFCCRYTQRSDLLNKDVIFSHAMGPKWN